MKKTISALLMALVCMMSFSACKGGNGGESDILLQIAEANTFEALTKNNETVAFRSNSYYFDGNIDSAYTYRDADRYVLEDNYGVLINENGEAYGFDNIEKISYKYLFAGEKAYEEFNQPESIILSSFVYTPNEKIVSMEEKDGKLYVSTILEDLSMNEEILAFYGYDVASAESTYDEYIVDAKTYEIISSSMGFTTKSGEKELIYEEFRVADQDLEKYQPDEQLIKAINEGEQHTLTLIADEGTAEEKSYAVTVGKDCYITPWISSEFDYNVYTDPECTQIVEDIAMNGQDKTYYLKRINN